MAGNSWQALKVAGFVALFGSLIGLIAWPFEPKFVSVWGAEIPRIVAVFFLPAAGIGTSLLLVLFVQCDPLISSHSSNSGASVATTIVLPTAISVILHIIVLWAGLAKHILSTTPIVFVSGLLLIALGAIFRSIEQNYVVGVRDLWTLRSSRVWERTHVLAWKLNVVSGILLLVLAFIVPAGFWALLTIVGVYLFPTLSSIGYSYVIRDDQYTYIVR